jgi:hypothetical protein
VASGDKGGGEIVGPNGSTALRCFEVLVEHQDFHGAKKRKRSSVSEIIYWGTRKRKQLSRHYVQTQL